MQSVFLIILAHFVPEHGAEMNAFVGREVAVLADGLDQLQGFEILVGFLLHDLLLGLRSATTTAAATTTTQRTGVIPTSSSSSRVSGAFFLGQCLIVRV